MAGLWWYFMSRYHNIISFVLQVAWQGWHYDSWFSVSDEWDKTYDLVKLVPCRIVWHVNWSLVWQKGKSKMIKRDGPSFQRWQPFERIVPDSSCRTGVDHINYQARLLLLLSCRRECECSAQSKRFTTYNAIRWATPFGNKQRLFDSWAAHTVSLCHFDHVLGNDQQ